MPQRRRRAAQRRQVQSSGSDSESSNESGGRETVLQEAAYRQLQLGAALRRPPDFAAAAAELQGVVAHLLPTRCSKAVLSMAVEDVALAIDCCDSRLQSRAALAALMEAAERSLPQAKRSALQRRFRQSSVQLRRQERRSADWADGDSSDEQEPAGFCHLPTDVIAHVFWYLDPVTLGRAACVNREWRLAASEDNLWRPHCTCILRCRVPRRLTRLPQGASSCCGGGGDFTSSSSGGGGYRQRFAEVARQHPERLLPWRTNRVLVGRKLSWLRADQEPAGKHRHLSADAVLDFLKSAGRRHGAGRSSSSSGTSSDSSGSEGEGGEQAGLSRRLRFWQL